MLMFCNSSPLSPTMIPFRIAAFSIFGRKSHVTRGVYGHSFPSSIGDAYLRNTAKAFSWVPSTKTTKKKPVCKGTVGLSPTGTNVTLEYL